MKASTFDLLALAATGSAYSTSAPGTQSGCYWNVPGVGPFNTRYVSNFATQLTSEIVGLETSVYAIGAGVSPFGRKFDTNNVGLSLAQGAISLTVPGGQTAGPISSAQLTTPYSDILYGSVRTVAKISSVPGTTHGFTFYSNDTQEIDFAFVTYDTTMVHLTNEQVSADANSTSYSVAAPSDATSAYHEYRVDWTPGMTRFFIDGVLVQTITNNVPSTPGFWLWNNWSSGNSWAKGPPVSANVLYIRSIDGYFNRTSVAQSISSGAASCTIVPEILSVYYATSNVTAKAKTVFASGSINTSNLKSQVGGSPSTTTTNTLTVLYSMGGEIRVFIAAEGSGTYDISQPGVPYSVVPSGMTAPRAAGIKILSVVWGLAQITAQSAWNNIYADQTSGSSVEFDSWIFGTDTWWGTVKSGVIFYYNAQGTLSAISGAEGRYVPFP